MAEASQRKLRQMLALLTMLNSKFGRSKKSLAVHFDCSVKTIGRYINTFKDVGFVIDKNDDLLKINKEESEYKDLSELLHFSEDESLILTNAIKSIDATNELKEQLKKKLYSIYNFDRVATPVVKKHNKRVVQKLIKAISDKKQVKLIKYRSANSQNISDRVTEPFDFTQNYTSVWAYEPESGICKTFKINRITNIEILNQKQAFPENHKKSNLDVFRMNGNEKIPIKLRLSIKAYNLLIEEYPRAEIFTKKAKNNHYIFETEVTSLFGIRRFILGLPADIEIIQPQKLKDYIVSEMKKGIERFG
ncbi:MAG: WYL domain-containing protein [Chlorobi bacterium]|nr:WYL domain-containing protein [Chlorobiota bacterium]